MDEALAAFGLVADRPAVRLKVFWLWPENKPAFDVWQRLQTQWQVGPGGPVGLLYPGVEVVMARCGYHRKRADRLFLELQHMENAALAAWQEKKN